MWNEEVNINGGPRADWLKANHLDGNSSPADWFQTFLPVFDGRLSLPMGFKHSILDTQVGKFFEHEGCINGSWCVRWNVP